MRHRMMGSLLVHAVLDSDEAAVRRLLAGGARADRYDVNGRLSLH